MKTEPSPPSPGTPERLFTRVTAVLLAAGLVVAVASHALLKLAQDYGGAAAEAARLSEHQAAAARTIVNTLDRLLILPDGPERQQDQTKLAWDVERMIAHDSRRSGSAPEHLFEFFEALDTGTAEALALARAGQISTERVSNLKTAFTSEIQPQLDLIAVENRIEADLYHRRSDLVLAASLTGQAVMWIGLYALCVRRARRTIGDWVAETTETAQENQHRLLHDSLTGLPNAAYLHAYLARLVAASDRKETQTAILRIDFDRFKVLRETLGTKVSDEVLRIATRRIKQTLRAGDFAAYLGQDDFVVVTAELEDGNDVAAIAGRIQAAMNKPFAVRNGVRRLACSIGVTLLHDDVADADLILANAEIALSEAQAEGLGLVRYFNEGQREEVERREALYAELTHGLESGEVIAFFQPQIDLQSGEFAGFEALVRWQHPKHGLLSPGAFLDFAEETDLTERLGEVVLTCTVEALRAWDQAGFRVPKVGVNFALAQLRNPSLTEKIKWEAERFDIDPSRLAIEVLETVLIKSDADLVVRNLRGLASAGFGIELDDFGTGHASISNLRRFMVNRIKIDRGFVFGIETSEEQQQLTASMIAMAKALGIQTLAEGVETEDAELMLRKLGCNYCQGYLIAKPMSLEDTMSWLEAYRTRPYAIGGSTPS